MSTSASTTRLCARETARLITSKGDVVLLDAEIADHLPAGHLYVLNGYARLNPSRRLNMKAFLIHRWILGLEKGDGKIVDHINGNRLDNRRENLRLVTKSLNALNKHEAYASGSSGFLGVHIDSRRVRNPYRAAITVNQRHVSLGVFPAIEDASAAYREAKELIFSMQMEAAC